MSHEAMKVFMEQAAGDATLGGLFRDAVSQNDGQAAIEAVTRVAVEAGHDVTSEDVSAFRSRALSALEHGELTDENLNGVSGGLFGADDLAFATIGVSLVALPVLGAATGALATTGLGGIGVAVGAAVDKDFGNKVVDFFSKW